jgi:hypothetical protein
MTQLQDAQCAAFQLEKVRDKLPLGAERECAYAPMRTADCPACGEKVKPAAAACCHCSAILDQEKAAKHGLDLRTAKIDEKRSGSDSAEKKGRVSRLANRIPAKEALRNSVYWPNNEEKQSPKTASPEEVFAELMRSSSN